MDVKSMSFAHQHGDIAHCSALRAKCCGVLASPLQALTRRSSPAALIADVNNSDEFALFCAQLATDSTIRRLQIIGTLGGYVCGRL